MVEETSERTLMSDPGVGELEPEVYRRAVKMAEALHKPWVEAKAFVLTHQREVTAVSMAALGLVLAHASGGPRVAEAGGPPTPTLDLIQQAAKDGTLKDAVNILTGGYEKDASVTAKGTAKAMEILVVGANEASKCKGDS